MFYNQGFWYELSYSPFAGIRKWLVQHSHVYRHLFNSRLLKTMNRRAQRTMGDPTLYENFLESVTSVYVDNVLWMYNSCRLRDIPCVIFIQPARAVTMNNRGRHRPS
ncbi:hypothetical protein ACFL2Q_15610 [Thermodesulfobacteriota bacterium]